MTTMDLKRGRASLSLGLLRWGFEHHQHYRFATTRLLGLIPHPQRSEKFLVPEARFALVIGGNGKIASARLALPDQIASEVFKLAPGSVFFSPEFS